MMFTRHRYNNNDNNNMHCIYLNIIYTHTLIISVKKKTKIINENYISTPTNRHEEQ